MADSGKDDANFEECFYGTATVGERGQIVIPAEARRRHQIETGDKLLIMAAAGGKGLILFKIGAMRNFVTKMMEGLQQFDAEDQGEAEPKKVA
jgi:AbrB family looped-hinge helix DNA binding protein